LYSVRRSFCWLQKACKNKEIAEQINVGRVQVSRWRKRYAAQRLEGIERDLQRGAPPCKVDVEQLIEKTTQSTPVNATYWSTRCMAAELGVSGASVSRYWRINGLKPHLSHTFKVSQDPQFVNKLEDIVERSRYAAGYRPSPSR